MLPIIPVKGKATRRQVVRFGGLNRTGDCREGELADCQGLSAEEWPCLSQRRGRRWRSTSSPNYTDLYAFGKLLLLADTTLYCGTTYVGRLSRGEKQFAALDNKVCIFPDKKYLDLTDNKLKDMNARGELVRSTVRFESGALELRGKHAILGAQYTYQRTLTGSDITTRIKFKTYKLENIHWSPETGWRLVDGEVKTIHQLKAGDCMMLFESNSGSKDKPIYSWDNDGGFNGPFDPNGEFVCLCAAPEFNSSTQVSDIKLLLERRSAAAVNPDLTTLGFRVGDTVTLSGCVTFPENNGDVRITEITDTRLVFDTETLTPGDEKAGVKLERWVPQLDLVCVGGGRLFGVNNAEKRVYISALGDPCNFRDYRGLRESSAVLPLPDGGDVTGCVAYGGAVLFWKEDRLHRLMGDKPGSFAFYTDHVPGLQQHSRRSMDILGGALYYKGREGIYTYTGSAPRLISQALGSTAYTQAAAGSDGRRYYVSMRREDTQEWELLTYDSQTELWLKEESLRVRAFAWLDGALHVLTGGAYYVLGQGELDTHSSGSGTPIPWEAVFVPFDETTHQRKYPSRLLLRLELEEGAWVEASIARDGGEFKQVWSSHDADVTTAVIPIRPGRCDRWQLRLLGKGRCRVESMAREFTLGGVK